MYSLSCLGILFVKVWIKRGNTRMPQIGAFLSLSPTVLRKSPFPYYTCRIIFSSPSKATARSFVICSYFVVLSFQADLTGAARALKKGNKITRERTKVMTRAATVKRRPVNRFVSFSVCFVFFTIKDLCSSLPHFCQIINPLLHSSEQVARKKSKRQKRAAKKAEEDFLYKVRPTGIQR